MNYSDFRIEDLLAEDGVSAQCVIPPCSADMRMAESVKAALRTHVAVPVQTHSLNVKVVDTADACLDDTDALITFRKDFPIGVFTADCVPILAYAPDVCGVAAVHAGWKGTLGGILDRTLDILEEKGASASSLRIVFGPSISRKMYEVDDTLAQKFVDAGFFDCVSFPETGGKPHLDLQGVNVERLLKRGVERGNIRIHSGCTFSTRLSDGTFPYHSHRRSGGAPDRMLTCIMMRTSCH